MCAAPLVDNSDATSGSLTVVDFQLPDTKMLVKPPRARQTGVLGVNSISIFVDNSDEPLLLEVTNQAILGRYVPESTSQPRVDLTPYGAVEKGVSRMHAVIRRTATGLTVQDLSSSNGTWLNSVRLQPYVPAALKPGDRLLLGQILIEIVFEDRTAKTSG